MLALGTGASAQIQSPEKAASLAGKPVISLPAPGDTVASIWVNLVGAIPQELLGKCREVQVYVNEAMRGKARLRGSRFGMEDLRLDCRGPVSSNLIKVVCMGPGLKVESDPVPVTFVPGPLVIEADLNTDAISPAPGGGAEAHPGAHRSVSFHFKFSAPSDWSLKITGGEEGAIVRAAEGHDAPFADFEWDGTDVTGRVAADGEYIYEVAATSTCGDAGSAHYAGVVAIDTSVPDRPFLSDPVEGEILSPTFNLRWQPTAGAWFYEVQLSESSDFDSAETYSTGATHLKFAGRSDGVYHWRVRGVSRAGVPGPFSDAGSFEVRKVMLPAISMLGVTTRADGMTPEKGEAMRVTYMANDDIVVTIRITTPSGELVRTLLDGARRNKGPHVEMWDGRDDQYELVPAGAYVASIEADGTENVTAFSESRLVIVQY